MRTTLDRLLAKVEVAPSGCWEFTGYRDKRGYGRISDGTGAPRLAHRVSYQLHVGAIPDGLDLDHLCRNPACVNPEHLEAVTHQVNCARGDVGKWRGGICPFGHDLDNPENTYPHTRGQGRKCKPCALRRARERHARLKEGAAA